MGFVLSHIIRNDWETRFPVLFYFLCKFRFNNFSKEATYKYQQSKIKSIVKFAYNNSEFYKEHYSGFDTGDFFSLPLVNKKIMMNNLTGFNTLGFTKEEIMDFCLRTEDTRDFSKRYKGVNIGMSSGTSGNKGVELVTRREENYMRAALLSRFDFPKKEKINLAFILRVSSPAFNFNLFGHKMMYISQLKPLEEIVGELQNINPNVLSAPASMLKVIAQEIEKGKLSINPKRVISYAEVLYPDVKIYLEKIFKSTIHQIYKCTEGPIAISCKYGNLHINEDLVFIELYDENNNQAPPGKSCYKMIVTDLHKRSQPIIRYELNDVITIDKKSCKCGSHFRVIKEIQGRSDDMFWGIKKLTGEKQFIYQDYIARAIISVSDDINDFQAIQTGYKKITVRLVLNESADKNLIETKLIKSIENIYEKYICEKPDIKVVIGNPLPNENSHKLSRVICQIKK